MSSSESSDIEVVSVKFDGSKDPKDLPEFIWSEISNQNKLSFASLRKALCKYDIEASDQQVKEMIDLTSDCGSLDLTKFRVFLHHAKLI